MRRWNEIILNFIREQIEGTPLDELIPNLQSEPHAYALRAAVYLQKDGEYARGTSLAKTELEKGLQLVPNDPLLLLWERVLAVHEGRCFPQNEYLPSLYRAQAEILTRFSDEHKRLSAHGAPPVLPGGDRFPAAIWEVLFNLNSTDLQSRSRQTTRSSSV